MYKARIPCDSRSLFPYERNRSRNTKNTERAKQPLLLLTSAILNHNCPALLVRWIHKRKASVSPPSFRPSLLSSSLILFAVLSSSRAIALLLLLSGIPTLALPLSRLCPPMPLFSSWATSGAALPPPPSPSPFWWGLNYHNFVLFIPRGKKRG